VEVEFFFNVDEITEYRIPYDNRQHNQASFCQLVVQAIFNRFLEAGWEFGNAREDEILGREPDLSKWQLRIRSIYTDRAARKSYTRDEGNKLYSEI